MKYTTMSYTFSRQKDSFDLKKMLEFTARHMDGIDFVRLHEQTPQDLRHMVDDLGIPVVCHTFLCPELTAAAPEQRQPAVDQAKRGIEAAVILGAPIVMIPTPGKAEEKRNQWRQAWVRGLAEVIDLARQAGITLTIENFPGNHSPFVLAADFQEAQAAVPDLKLTYDNGNAGSGEDPAESFRQCADHVVHAHFKDWEVIDSPREGYRPMLDGRFYRAALIGEGDIDHRACLKAMTESGYDGCINIEYEGDKYDPFEATRKAVDYLRGLE